MLYADDKLAVQEAREATPPQNAKKPKTPKQPHAELANRGKKSSSAEEPTAEEPTAEMSVDVSVAVEESTVFEGQVPAADAPAPVIISAPLEDLRETHPEQQST